MTKRIGRRMTRLKEKYKAIKNMRKIKKKKQLQGDGRKQGDRQKEQNQTFRGRQRIEKKKFKVLVGLKKLKLVPWGLYKLKQFKNDIPLEIKILKYWVLYPLGAWVVWVYRVPMGLA